MNYYDAQMIFEEYINMLKNYPINKIVFWVGAGIDADFPTSLPLGFDLTSYFLNMACGDKIGTKILKFWENREKNLKNIDCSISINWIPRLETVLEAIRQFENSLIGDNSPNIIKGLESFGDAPPNNIHYILADLLNKGANIVTTNYDNCIPKAYYSLYNSKMKLVGNDGIYVYECGNEQAGKIYHLHGVSNDIKNIGATLSVVKNPVGKFFDSKMTEWLKNGNLFIFLGYGGVDSLDITPYLQSKKTLSKSIGLYVRHSNEINNKNFVKPTENEKKLMNCFVEKYVINTNTNNFMVNIFNKNYGDWIAKVNYNWKEKFNKYCIAYTEQYMNLCSWAVVDYLDCCPNNILGKDWILKCNGNMKNKVDLWYFVNFGFRNCIRDGDKENAYKFTDLLPKSNLLRSDIMASKAKVISPFISWIYVDIILKQAEKKIKGKEVIDWKISTPINRAVYFIVGFITTSPFNIEVSKFFVRKKSKKILLVVEKMIQLGSLYFLDIRQLYVAYLNLAVLEVIFNKDYKKSKAYIYEARYNYGEISCVAGVINSFIFEMVYLEFLYLDNPEEKIKKEILVKNDKIQKIIEIEKYENKYNWILDTIRKFDKKVNKALIR